VVDGFGAWEFFRRPIFGLHGVSTPVASSAPVLRVQDVMQPDPVCVAPECPIRDVLDVMTGVRIGAVPVVAQSQLVGIFTERDLLRRVVSAIPGWRDYPVSDWMTPNPHVITPDVDWDQAVGMMTRVTDGTPCGVSESANRAEYRGVTACERPLAGQGLGSNVLPAGGGPTADAAVVAAATTPLG
jgi:CBS domain-containing protein